MPLLAAAPTAGRDAEPRTPTGSDPSSPAPTEKPTTSGPIQAQPTEGGWSPGQGSESTTVPAAAAPDSVEQETRDGAPGPAATPTGDESVPASAARLPLPGPDGHGDVPAPPRDDGDAIVLADLSGRVYAPVPGGFAPPPLSPTQARPSHRRWLGRLSPWAPTQTGALVADLAQGRHVLLAAIGDEPVMVPEVEVADGGSSAYRVSAIEPACVLESGEEAGRPRTLDLALSVRAAQGDVTADALDRLELARLVAIALAGLHRCDLVTDGFGWDTFVFTLDPRPAVALTRPDRLRRVGSEFLDPAGPAADKHAVGPFDTDRSRLAELLRGLLLDPGPDVPADWSTVDDVPGLTPPVTRVLCRLGERALGAAGTRPQAAEWVAALGAPQVAAAAGRGGVT